MQSLTLPLAQIHLNDDNPRLIKDARFQQLVKSLQEFPEMLALRPLVVDEAYTVLGGNMRLRAMQHLGYTEALVTVAEGLTEQQKREFIIKDNGSYGENDWDLLSSGDWPDAATLNDWGLDIPADWGAVVELPAAEEGEPNLEPPAEPVTVLGDLYELNGHRLHCADSADSDAVAKLMDGRVADLVYTDPPYDLAPEWVGALLPYCRKHWLVMAGDRQQAQLCALLPAQFNQFFVLYFRRFSWNLNKYIPLLTHVLTAHFKFEAAKNYDLKGMHSLVEQACKTDDAQEHKHAKAVPYVVPFLEAFSRDGELVADVFGGSGTTLIAAEQTGRTCYAQELDAGFCDVIVRRWLRYMTDSNRPFTVKRNGTELAAAELAQFNA